MKMKTGWKNRKTQQKHTKTTTINRGSVTRQLRVEVSQRHVILLGSTRTTVKINKSPKLKRSLTPYTFLLTGCTRKGTYISLIVSAVYRDLTGCTRKGTYISLFQLCTEIWPEAVQCKPYTTPHIRVFNGSEKMAQRQTVLHNPHPWGWITWGGIERGAESTDP